MKKRSIHACAFLLGVLFFSPGAVIAQENSYTIVIKDHHFSPTPLRIPAGQKVKIIIDNQDPTAEEFESAALNREKVVSGGKKATIFVGPLKPGSYSYFGEFHEKIAQGVIVAE